MPRYCYNSKYCLEQDISQALQALVSMPKDTVLQKMRAEGKLTQSPAYADLHRLSAHDDRLSSVAPTSYTSLQSHLEGFKS